VSSPDTKTAFFRALMRNHQCLLFWVTIAALLGGAYLLYAWVSYGIVGFPLDDAWIHQTYARNLGTLGEWTFQRGEVSAGSTAPLWSILLALGYRLGVPYLVWTYMLGIFVLGTTSWLAARISARLLPGNPFAAWVAGMASVTQWQLVWASISGMETVLYACLGLTLVYLACSSRPASDSPQPAEGRRSEEFAHPEFLARRTKYFVAGLVGGLLVLTRPEGLLLVGLVALCVIWELRYNLRRLATLGGLLGLGVVLPLLPYLVFHLTTSGYPFPNTLYAKQQEYRALLEMYPLGQRWLMVATAALVGGQVLLLPGFLFAIWRVVLVAQRDNAPERNPRGLTILVLAGWWFAHLTLYALQLPLTYQHGRYQMPVLVAFLVVGVTGSVVLLDRFQRGTIRRLLERTILIAGAVTNLTFLVLGAQAYAHDVGFIEGEMVATARWLAANTSEESLIAVHDIGAVGYFAERRLIDLAGLITPQIIPIMDDEQALLRFVEAKKCDYIVFFPDWSPAYRRMAQDSRLEQVFSSGHAWTRAQGRENMTVYRLQRRSP